MLIVDLILHVPCIRLQYIYIMLIVEFHDAKARISYVIWEELVGRKERMSSTRLQGPLAKLVLPDNHVGIGLAIIEVTKGTEVPDWDASNRRLGSALCSSQSNQRYHLVLCVRVLLSELLFFSFLRGRSTLQHIFLFRILRQEKRRDMNKLWTKCFKLIALRSPKRHVIISRLSAGAYLPIEKRLALHSDNVTSCCVLSDVMLKQVKHNWGLSRAESPAIWLQPLFLLSASFKWTRPREKTKAPLFT